MSAPLVFLSLLLFLYQSSTSVGTDVRFFSELKTYETQSNKATLFQAANVNASTSTVTVTVKTIHHYSNGGLTTFQKISKSQMDFRKKLISLDGVVAWSRFVWSVVVVKLDYFNFKGGVFFVLPLESNQTFNITASLQFFS